MRIHRQLQTPIYDNLQELPERTGGQSSAKPAGTNMQVSQPHQIARLQIVLFCAASLLMATSMGVFESVFSNFLSDTFGLSGQDRGWIELPREFPGVLVVAMAGVLAVLPVTRLGVVGAVLFGVGMIGLAVFGASMRPMIAMMMVASAGHHLLQPVGTSIALGMSNSNNRGWRMGQIRSVGTIGTILGCGFVWLFFKKAQMQYHLAFICAAAVAGMVAIIYGIMHIPHLHQPRARLVVRKKYRLYYVLEFLFGARKQIFLTFGPWVLVRIYHEPASGIARLFVIAALIGIVFKPLAGLLIDRLGERVIMVADGLMLVAVCLGYGYAKHIASVENARIIACWCFVADNLLFFLGVARATYLSRLTHSAQDLTSTLSMGISINHVVSMLIPIVAGMLWMKWGYETVFLAGAGLALMIAAVSLLVPRRRTLIAQEAAGNV